MVVTVLQFVGVTYLMFVIVKYVSYDTNSSGCFLGKHNLFLNDISIHTCLYIYIYIYLYLCMYIDINILNVCAISYLL